MKEKSLKSRASTGMLWNAIENFSVQIGQFAIGIVLARMLLPADFGLIGMLAIFIAIAQSLIDSGMGTALIQKKERSEIDFSTVFFFNLSLSIAIYLILFISAPYIAAFYKIPQLSILTRVLTLNIVINSLSLVQNARHNINLNFKLLAKVNVLSMCIGGFSAIYFAYNGYGVWALVIQNLVRSLISVILLWYFTHWKPLFKFSTDSFNSLFGFGSKLLGAGLIATLFNNIYKVLIGKYYTANTLGYYTQAFQFADVSAGTITNILQKVTFPILTSLQDNEEKMISVYRRMISMTSFIVFPAMCLLALISEPLILFCLTDKWLESASLLQWLCFARIIYPISAINMNILNARGRSDLFLKVDLSKLPITIILLIITIPMGIKAVVIGHVISSLSAFFINAYLPGKLFGYGAWEQLKDMSDKAIATIIMCFTTYIAVNYFEEPIFQLIIGCTVALVTYFISAKILRVNELKEVFILLKSMKLRSQ